MLRSRAAWGVRLRRASPGPAGALLLAYLAVFWGWYFLSGMSGTLRTALSDGAYLPAELTAIMLAVVAARCRALTRPARRAWALVAAALLARLWGDVSWLWLEAVRHTAPFPSVADVGFVGFYPLLLAALLRLPVRTRSGAHRRLLALDLVTVTACGFVGVWYLGLSSAVSQGGGQHRRGAERDLRLW